MQDIIKELKQIGLTKTEVKIYLTLLEYGENLAGFIGDKANLYRKNVYDALSTLQKKGLVSVVIKSGKKYWLPVNPDKIKNILEEKMAAIENILPALKEKFDKNNIENNITFFEGLGGIKTFLTNIVNENKTVYIVGATGKGFSQLNYFIYTWIKKINKAKIQFCSLFNHNAIDINRFVKEFKYFKYRKLPKNFSTPTQIFLYGNKSGILIWSENPLCVLIENKEIHKGFKQYFKFMWEISKK